MQKTGIFHDLGIHIVIFAVLPTQTEKHLSL